jgi:hypothetical protein
MPRRASFRFLRGRISSDDYAARKLRIQKISSRAVRMCRYQHGHIGREKWTRSNLIFDPRVCDLHAVSSLFG